MSPSPVLADRPGPVGSPTGPVGGKINEKVVQKSLGGVVAISVVCFAAIVGTTVGAAAVIVDNHTYGTQSKTVDVVFGGAGLGAIALFGAVGYGYSKAGRRTNAAAFEVAVQLLSYPPEITQTFLNPTATVYLYEALEAIKVELDAPGTDLLRNFGKDVRSLLQLRGKLTALAATINCDDKSTLELVYPEGRDACELNKLIADLQQRGI